MKLLETMKTGKWRLDLWQDGRIEAMSFYATRPNLIHILWPFHSTAHAGVPDYVVQCISIMRDRNRGSQRLHLSWRLATHHAKVTRIPVCIDRVGLINGEPGVYNRENWL